MYVILVYCPCRSWKSSLSMRVLELTGNLGLELQQIAWKAAAATTTMNQPEPTTTSSSILTD